MKKLEDPNLKSISKSLDKTSAQILLRWAIEHDLVVTPKTVNKERIIENANIFDFYLQEENMRILDTMNENFRTCWDPSTAD